MHHHPEVSLQSVAEDQLKGPSELPTKFKCLQSLFFFLTVPIKNLLWVSFSSNFCPNHVLQLRSEVSCTSPSHPAFLCEMKAKWRPQQFLCGVLMGGPYLLTSLACMLQSLQAVHPNEERIYKLLFSSSICIHEWAP